MKPIIAPSILSADFGYLAKDIEMVNRSEAEWVHIDIMDGVFVPNISFGFPVLKYVAKLSKKPLDVHLMIVNPEKFIPEVKALGAHTMNVHYEACPHLHRVIQQIREAGMQPAVTINPATPVALLQDIIDGCKKYSTEELQFVQLTNHFYRILCTKDSISSHQRIGSRLNQSGSCFQTVT